MEGSTLSETETYMQRVKLLDLGESILFRHRQGSKQCLAMGDRMLQIADRLARHHGYQSRIDELKSQTSQLSKAIASLTKIAHPYENLSNSISGKDFGGGAYATFTSHELIYVMDWVLTYTFAIYGNLDCIPSIDIGSGLNYPAYHALMLDERFQFIGIEVDDNRCYLASHIAIQALPRLTEILGRELHIGTMHGDATSHFNLKGAIVVYIWDRGLLDNTVFTTYETMWRGYDQPFILVQSEFYWKSRSPYLSNYFNHVQVCGISKPLKFYRNSATDSLVLAFVAAPKDSPTTFLRPPPLHDDTPSLCNVLRSDFKNTATSIEEHEKLRRCLLNKMETAKRKRKPKKIISYDENGNLVTEEFASPK